jgi:two-component system, OmpR family, alkaline phosphatase synthesis response regulator PhoP
MRVLVAEDDVLIREGLVEILEDEGYEVVEAGDGDTALALYSRHRPDFVCLDIMMPGLSGYDVCREIRKLDARVPLVFVSAKSEEIDKVLGLELGGDDFITKPFGVREVIARVRAVSRRCLEARTPAAADDSFRIGDLQVHPARLRATRAGQAIDLSLRDVEILRLFADNPGIVLDRETLFDRCWGAQHYPASRSLDQHISQLRKRIEVEPPNPRIIRTVHGAGYRYEPDAV